MLDEVWRELLVTQRGICDDANQGALERPHAAGDGACQLVEDHRRRVDGVEPCALLENGPPDVEARLLERHDEPGAKALDQAVLELWKLLGAAVGGDDELAPGLEKSIERVKELLAGPLLAGQELDVVDQDHVRPAKALLEVGGAARAQRVDERARELVDCRVAHRQAPTEAAHVVPDRVQEVGLAETGWPVYEQRVVGLGGELR